MQLICNLTDTRAACSAGVFVSCCFGLSRRAARDYTDEDILIAGYTNGLYRLVGDDGVDQTVFNDNDVDTLTGSQGIDWFFANRENINDGNAVLDIEFGSEFWNDTD